MHVKLVLADIACIHDHIKELFVVIFLVTLAAQAASTGDILVVMAGEFGVRNYLLQLGVLVQTGADSL